MKKVNIVFVILVLSLSLSFCFVTKETQAIEGFKDDLELSELTKNTGRFKKLVIDNKSYILNARKDSRYNYNMYLEVYDKDFNLENNIKINSNPNKYTMFNNIEYNPVNKNIGIVWTEISTDPSNSDRSIFYQTVDMGGNKVGKRVKVSSNHLESFGLRVDSHDYPNLAYDDEGAGLIVWKAADEYNWSTHILGQKINRNGEKVKDLFILQAPDNQNDGVQYTDIIFNDGKYLLLWEHRYKVYLKVFNKDTIESEGNNNSILIDDNTASKGGLKIIPYKNQIITVYLDFRNVHTNGLEIRYKKLDKDFNLITESILIKGVIGHRSTDFYLKDNLLYTVASFHDLVGSDDDIWKIDLLTTNLNNDITEVERIKEFTKEAVDRNAMIIVNDDNIYISWVEKRGDDNTLLIKNYYREGTNNNKEEKKDETKNEEKVVVVKEENFNRENQINIRNKGMYLKLKGKIILEIEKNGEAWYIHPKKEIMYYLGRPVDAFRVMREQGVGITNNDLNKIPVATDYLNGLEALDSDGDGFNDKEELKGGYNPNGYGKLSYDNDFTNKNKGLIFLQVESKGEAWYINPNNGKRYYLGRPADAFNIMRTLGLGISNNDFESMK